MSDRFYTQMCTHFDMSPWELNRALYDHTSAEFKKLEKKCMPKVTRKELAKQFQELTNTDTDISKLTLETAIAVVDFVTSGKKANIIMPEGRKKDPYIQVLQSVLGKLDFSTATVVVMKGIIRAIKNETDSIL